MQLILGNLRPIMINAAPLLLHRRKNLKMMHFVISFFSAVQWIVMIRWNESIAAVIVNNKNIN